MVKRMLWSLLDLISARGAGLGNEVSMLAIVSVWHKQQLGETATWLSIWGHEALSSRGGRTAQSRAHQVGMGVRVRHGVAQGKVPEWRQGILEQLEYRARVRRRSDDLIYYGVTEGDRQS